MRFWDSSAIIPLCLKEESSERTEQLIKADEDMVVWWATRVECRSALSRRQRERVLSQKAELKAREILTLLSSHWSEVQPTELVRQRAERLLTLHSLKTADAFQLSAALIWAEEAPEDQVLICLDHNLREAAQREGFTVLPE